MDSKHLEFLLTRRSIRDFKDEEVPRELILEVLDVARWAPSSKNSQPWSFILVEDREKLKQLSKCYKWAEPLSRARVGIAIVGDPQVSPKTYMLDCANVTLYILLAVHALELGGVWINALNNECMRELLKIPDDKRLIAIVAIGWPKEEPKPKRRKPLRELVHFECYGNKGQL